MPKAAAKLGIDGVSWYRRMIEGVPVPSGDGVYSLMNETGLHSFIRWLGEVVRASRLPNSAGLRSYRRCMRRTFRTKSAARMFWDQVARGGVEYEDNHPTTVLDNWLKAIRENGESIKRELKPASFYQGSIFAWNAHREGKSINNVKHDVKKGFHRVVG